MDRRKHWNVKYQNENGADMLLRTRKATAQFMKHDLWAGSFLWKRKLETWYKIPYFSVQASTLVFLTPGYKTGNQKPDTRNLTPET
jgi:hypothetical protein